MTNPIKSNLTPVEGSSCGGCEPEDNGTSGSLPNCDSSSSLDGFIFQHNVNVDSGLEALEVPRLVRLLDKMERDGKKDWEEIFNRYPISTRTDEESDIVGAEQLRINGYLQAIDEIRDFIKANVNVDSGLKALDAPRLVPAPDSEGDSIGLGGTVDPVGLKSLGEVLNNPNIGTNYVGDTIIHSDLKVSLEIFERLTSDHHQIQP